MRGRGESLGAWRVALTTVSVWAWGVLFASGSAAALDRYAPKDSVSSIPPGYHVVEGDIVEPLPGRISTETAYVALLWPGGVVPYEFDANVSPGNQAQALLAMAQWAAISNGVCVSFTPRSGQANFIHFQNSTMNNSLVGMQSGGQAINITDWGTTFIIAHELAHALGYYHEQSRSDRDFYVAIHLENVCQTCCSGSCNSQFTIRPGMGAEWGPYDFDSVMHYGPCSFSTATDCPTNGMTITMQPGYEAFLNAIGQRNHLSTLDQMVMSFLYAPPSWRFVDPPRAVFTELGTFIFPFSTWGQGVASTPSGGTLWVTPGTYPGIATYSTPITIQAPVGGVTLQ